MEILNKFLTIVFIINCVLLILVILLQSSRSPGMNLFGGGSQSAFGASSTDVLTKITGYMAASFLILGLLIAYLKTGSQQDFEDIKEEIIKQEENTERPLKNEGQTAPTNPDNSPIPLGDASKNATSKNTK